MDSPKSMRYAKHLNSFFQFLQTNYPLPKGTECELIFYPRDKYPKSLDTHAYCTQLDKTHFRISMPFYSTKNRPMFLVGHEYKHALQRCYEGLTSADKKGGYLSTLAKWEIPANKFSQKVLKEFQAGGNL